VAILATLFPTPRFVAIDEADLARSARRVERHSPILCTGAPWKDMPPSLSVLKVERLFAWLQNSRPDFPSAFVKCLPTSRPNHRA
jgi:hypothetical protein